MTLRTGLLSIQAIMATPEPDDPQVGETGVTRSLGSHDPQDNQTIHRWVGQGSLGPWAAMTLRTVLLSIQALLATPEPDIHRWVGRGSLSLCAAAMTLRTVLLSIQALLATPEPDDPQVGRTGVTRSLDSHDPQDSAAQHPGALGHPGTRRSTGG
jgi:ubiquitin-protein ligase